MVQALPWFALLLFVAPAARGDVAVSIKEFKSASVPRHRLFLFDDAGKAIRALTEPDAADDTNPAFSPDGGHLVFQRGGAFYRVDRHGSYAKPLPSAPDWWKTVAQLAAFEDRQGGGVQSGETHASEPGVYRFTSPDRSVHIVARPHVQHRDAWELAVRSPADGEEQPAAGMPGFTRVSELLTFRRAPFLFVPPLRVAFVEGERRATRGAGLQALDFDRLRFVTIAEGGGRVFPLPGHAGFFCLREEREHSLPGALQGVNCQYLEWWSATLESTRFASDTGAFGGAAIEREGKRYAIRQPPRR